MTLKIDNADYEHLDQIVKDILVCMAKYFSVILKSGYRDDKRNMAAGGAPGSLHLKGKAADVIAIDTDPCKLVSWLLAHYADVIGGYGINVFNGEVHFDIRPKVNGQITKWVYDRNGRAI
jgi:uncharacterized protein YcbK (DUF882 family)